MNICLVHITEMPEGFHDVWFSMVEHSFKKVLRPDTKVTLKPIKRGLKGDNVLDFDNPYFALMDKREIIEAFIEADKEGFDAGAVHCFGDPGIKEAALSSACPSSAPLNAPCTWPASWGGALPSSHQHGGQRAQIEEQVREQGLEGRLIPNGVRFDKEPFVTAFGKWMGNPQLPQTALPRWPGNAWPMAPM